MDITCVSDLHGHYPELEGGDLLIVAGDLTANQTKEEFQNFISWLRKQPYIEKVFIAGNHDTMFMERTRRGRLFGDGICYLLDWGTEFEGLKIWGSPWTKRFPGMSPNAKAFTVDTEEELAEKWAMIPEDTDILITHCPPLGTFDVVGGDECLGSYSLSARIGGIDPKLHIFGHVHECGGKISDGRLIDKKLPGFFDVTRTIFINASHVNEHYKPVNKPIRVNL